MMKYFLTKLGWNIQEKEALSIFFTSTTALSLYTMTFTQVFSQPAIQLSQKDIQYTNVVSDCDYDYE